MSRGPSGPEPSFRLHRRLTACVVVLAMSGAGVARAEASPAAGAAAPPTVHTLTLITGDVVRVAVRADGRRSVSFEPGPGGTIPSAAISEVHGHLYVVPQAAVPLVSAHRLDRDLFDVTALVRDGYDDAQRATLPVIVDYGRSTAASVAATLPGARRTVLLPSLAAAAFAADKKRARVFWRSLTTGSNGAGAPVALSDGATRVDLDGRVHATLDPSVAQIHAPEAWAAGYDGAGTTVAVLDSGYDPTHPDLAGPVTATANFTDEPSVVDGNGHGTHVASTIAGTGAASGGLHGGVAPGARLAIGKVLGSDGSGQDSWVLAGMQWAVASGADVVNMSLGGDVGDGTDPLSRAVDELSATSTTLFVVAAGNSGNAPSTITAPGAADAALTVGAVDGNDAMAYFSSRGPRSGDGAVKPDVVAPGVQITAARAAGTSLGTPVDAWYTTLDGTSMATPHVSGVAAILKQEHPGWTGQQLKAAITASAVPVADASAFDAGSGRVDAQRAIQQTVISNPSVNLGFYRWPQRDLAPTRTPLTYTNLGSQPVELALSLGAEDGTGEPPPGVSLSASSLALPAGGTAAVDVVLDPSVPGFGTFSGVVTAETGTGSSVRTSFGFGIESEHYDLTLQIDPRPGTTHASHVVGLSGLDTGFFDQRAVDGDGPQTVTFRVPPGTYAAGAITFGVERDGASSGVMSYEPTVRVDADTTVVLDEADARRFDYTTDRPVVSDGQIMSVDWNGTAGATGFTLAGAVDRLYARPLASGPDGSVDSALNWMLSQPDAVLRPAGGESVPLRVLAAPGQRTWDVPVPALSATADVVDAGDAAAPDTSAVRGSVALLAGSCTDLTAAADALATAGATALVAYAADGADCAGTLTGAAPLPSFQARPYDVQSLLGGGSRTARLVSHRSPRYIYDLAGAWDGRVPAGATLDGSRGAVAALVEHYSSLAGPTRSLYRVSDMPIGWVPGRGSAAYGLVRPVAVPGTVTHYVSPIAEWERTVTVEDAAGTTQALFYAPKVPVVAGSTTEDRWLAGPVASGVSPLAAQFGWQGAPYREGDYLWMYMPDQIDSAGHEGSTQYLDEFEGRLYRDHKLVIQTDDPLGLQGEMPPERHRYRLVYTVTPQTPFWQRSTLTRTAWGFDSERPAGDHDALPLMVVDWNLALSRLNTAPAGVPYSFGVRFGMPPGVSVAPTMQVRVDLSWDGGATWTRAKARDCQPASGCTVSVVNRASGSASLRVSATDMAGRSVTQTIIDAYAVAPAS